MGSFIFCAVVFFNYKIFDVCSGGQMATGSVVWNKTVFLFVKYNVSFDVSNLTRLKFFLQILRDYMWHDFFEKQSPEVLCTANLLNEKLRLWVLRNFYKYLFL